MVDSFFKPIVLFYALGPKWWCCLVAKLYRTLLRSHGLQPARLLCPWNSPGKNTGVVAISFSRGSSWPRSRTHVSCTGRITLPLSHPWSHVMPSVLSVAWLKLRAGTVGSREEHRLPGPFIVLDMFCVGEEFFPCYTTTGHTEASLLFQYHTASLVCFWQFKIYNSLNHPTFMLSFKDFFFFGCGPFLKSLLNLL